MDIREKLIISRPLYLKDDECGYCHHGKPQPQAFPTTSWCDFYSSRTDKTPPSISLGFQAENMTVEQYDQLINKGFRRSGSFVYKPDLLRGCCKMFTIRTNIGMFKVNKEHRQTVNKFNKRVGIGAHEDNGGGGGGFDLSRELRKMDECERLRIEFEPSVFTKDKFRLFTKYQNHIHNDYKTSEKSFKRFLCDTPFNQSNGSIKNDSVVKYGAIHQCYYLDSKLIAVGFLDLLPSGVSSIYFIYDPEYKELGLGKISGLKEMELSERLGLKYYYLGYFIEDCPKMNYKKKFGGEILNVVDWKYYKYQDIKRFMENGDFCVIREGVNVVEELYGVEGSEFKEALEYGSHWQGVDYKNVHNDVLIMDEENDNPYEIPTVIPGVIPLKKLANEWDTSQVKMMIFEDGFIRPVIYDLENKRTKKVILDTYRLIGLDLLNQSVVFV